MKKWQKTYGANIKSIC